MDDTKGRPPPAPAAGEDAALKKSLLVRIGIGAALIALLVGGLALYDAMNRRPPPVAPAPLAKAPPPVPEASPAAAEPAAGKSAEPEPRADTAPATPEKTEAPAAAGRPVAPAAETAERPAARPALPARKVEDRLQLAPPPAAAAPPAAPAARPAAPPGRGYLVQVGVFANAANAEDLRDRLARNGIPAQVEVHVQAGPFGSRREAQEATRKLRALGITSTMLVPPRR